MAERTAGIGPVPEGLSEELTGFLAQMRRLVDQGVRSGALASGGSGGSGRGTTVIIGGGGGSGGGGTTEPDYTPPPSPTNFAASGGLTFVFVETDPPTFTQGHGYLRTNVYGAKWPYGQPIGPTFADAELVHQFTGQVAAFPSEPATRWALWSKWETQDGILSTSPAGGTSGVIAETGQDVGLLLEALTGQITESQLYNALGDKIAALDPEQLESLGQSVLRAVTALRQEARDRVQGLAQEASARGDALLAEAVARGAAITQVQTILQAADLSLSQRIDTLTSAVTLGDQTNASAIQTEAQARADADTAEAQQRTLLAAQVQTNDAQVRGLIEDTSRTSVDAAHAEAEQRLLLLSTTYTQNQQTHAVISLEQRTRTEADLAEATSRETLAVKLIGTADPTGATLATVTSGLLADEKSARVTQDSAQVQRLEVLEAKVDIPGGSSISSILTAYATLATMTSAIATATTTITAGYQDADTVLQGAISTEVGVRADQTGYLGGLYTVRVQLTNNGRTVVGGFGLSGTNSGSAGSEIAFGVRADRFWVGAPSSAGGVDDILPFVIQTTDQVVNGVTIPKGVYMDAAYIKNLTAAIARLGNAWIDNLMVANVSAAKLIAGSIAVGEYIQSSTYVSGVSGWRISGNGFAELSGVVVRGTVWAEDGEFASTVRLGDASGFATGTGIWQGIDSSVAKWRVGDPTGKRIQWDGTSLEVYGASNTRVLAVSGNNLEINSPKFTLDSAGNATFSGDISGATGTFSGSLAAGVLDPSKLVGQNFTYETPGTYTVITMPYNGKVRFTLCGAGGGGGSGGSVGGSGIAGLPGGAGAVTTAEVTVAEGTVVTVFIPTGGAGAAQTGAVTSPPSGSTGGTASLTISGVGTWYANGGAGGGISTSPSGGISYLYSMADPDDFGGVLVAPAGAVPSGVPGAYAGARALTGYGEFVGYLALNSNPAALNGGVGYRGGAGAGGAPTRAWVPSRELYADPVDGENGDGSPTSAGGRGGHGFAFIEVYNPNSVILRNEFTVVTDKLQAGLPVSLSGYTKVWGTGSSMGPIDLGTWGHGLYATRFSNGAVQTTWTNPFYNQVAGYYTTDPETGGAVTVTITEIHKATLLAVMS